MSTSILVILTAYQHPIRATAVEDSKWVTVCVVFVHIVYLKVCKKTAEIKCNPMLNKNIILQ